MREPHQRLSEYIADYLHVHNIGIPELSNQMDVAYTTISRWVKGSALPSMEQFAALAKATGIDGGVLFLRIFPDTRRTPNHYEVEASEYIRELSQEGQKVADALLSALVMKYAQKVDKD